MTIFLVVATLLSLALGAAALMVAVRALKNDRATAADTSKVAAEANKLQARMLAIEEGRRFDEMAPDFTLAYEPQYPDPRNPDCGRLLLTYDGSARCERLVIEELRGARWSTAAAAIEPHSPYTSTGNVTTDIHTHLEPGEVRPFVVRLDPNGKAGEIRLRLTATVDGHEYPSIVRSVNVEPPPPGPNIW